MGTLTALGDVWIVNGWANRYPSLQAAVAALVCTAEAGQALALAQRTLARDVEYVRKQLEWRHRWTRRALRVMLASVVVMALAVVFWSATALVVLALSGLLTSVAAVTLLFARDGIDYDREVNALCERLMSTAKELPSTNV